MPQFLFPIVVLILGIWMPTAFAQVEFQGTKLHQVQIAEPDTSGSVLVRSIDGRFSVRLPSKPDSAAVYETSPTEPVLRTFTVHAALPEGVNLSASRVVYRAGTNSAGFYFGRLWAQDFRAWKQNYFSRAWKLDPPATATQFVRRSINGNPAVDFLMKSPTHSSYVRAVLNAPDVVILTVDFSPSEGKTAEQLAKPFFDSLILSAKR